MWALLVASSLATPDSRPVAFPDQWAFDVEDSVDQDSDDQALMPSLQQPYAVGNVQERLAAGGLTAGPPAGGLTAGSSSRWCGHHPTGKAAALAYCNPNHGSASKCMAGDCPSGGSWLLRVEPCSSKSLAKLNKYWHGPHMTLSHHKNYSSWSKSPAKKIFADAERYVSYGAFNPRPEDFHYTSTPCSGGMMCKYYLKPGTSYNVLKYLGTKAGEAYKKHGLSHKTAITSNFHITVNSDSYCSIDHLKREVFEGHDSVGWMFSLLHVQMSKGKGGGYIADLTEKKQMS